MTDLDQKQLGKTLWNIAENLAALKTHKQGLMQQLFPSSEGG